jgi:hypothetical protein
MAKKKTKIIERVALERRQENLVPPDLETFYANNVNVELTSFDVRFRLGLIQGATPELLTVKDTAHVYMSHQHFMALVGVINATAAKINELYGGKIDGQKI